MSDDGKTGLRFGFGLAGLLSAALAFLAFEFRLFDGPQWRGALLAVSIGVVSAVVMLALDRAMGRKRRAPVDRPAKIKGPWGCPRCGAAYRPSVKECSDCHVPLVRRQEA